MAEPHDSQTAALKAAAGQLSAAIASLQQAQRLVEDALLERIEELQKEPKKCK